MWISAQPGQERYGGVKGGIDSGLPAGKAGSLARLSTKSPREAIFRLGSTRWRVARRKSPPGLPSCKIYQQFRLPAKKAGSFLQIMDKAISPKKMERHDFTPADEGFCMCVNGF